MTSTVSDKDRWREVYRQQRLKNAHIWLEELERTADPVALAADNYDKLLQAIEQTLKHEDSFSVGCDLLREITPIAFGMSDWGRLLIYLKSALANSRQLINLSNKAYLHEWIADIELSLTNLADAEKHFSQALQLYLKVGETVRYGRILPRMARLYASKGQLKKGIDLCNDALTIGTRDNEAIVIADAYFGLAEFSNRLNKWEDALYQCEKACSYYIEIGKQSFVFRTRALAVTCKVFLKRYDEAELEADELLEMFNQSKNAFDNLYDSITLRRVVGFMYFKQEDYFSAEKHWQEAYNQNMMVGAPDLAASIGNNLGMVYTKLGEYQEARARLSEALVLFEQMGDVPRWANCMDNLAEVYEKLGDWQACKHTLEEAIKRLEPEAIMPHSQLLLHNMQQKHEKLQGV
jgi:tetratricopeptide (TPR) repeat protein